VAPMSRVVAMVHRTAWLWSVAELRGGSYLASHLVAHRVGQPAEVDNSDRERDSHPFATVGIIALIDEATGYQEVRDRDALRQILEAYLRQELAAWVKRFPDEFYKEIYRLRNWPWPGMGKNRYSAVAGYTKDLIYERLAPGVLEEMEKRNPKDEKGYRKGKHHQLLSEDLGIPKLQEHFAAVLALLRAHDSWDEFYAKMQRSLPKRDDIPLLQYGESRSTAA
jgi:hypothetical protein